MEKKEKQLIDECNQGNGMSCGMIAIEYQAKNTVAGNKFAREFFEKGAALNDTGCILFLAEMDGQVSFEPR